jgi:hypothetical protein
MELIIFSSDYAAESHFGPEPTANYNFKRADFVGLTHELNCTNWNLLLDSDDVDVMVSNLYSRIISLLDEFVPKFRCNKAKAKPWLSRNALSLRNKRRSAGRRAALSGTEADALAYNNLNNEFLEVNEREYVEFVKNEGAKLANDPAQFWKWVNQKRKVNELPSSMTLDGSSAAEDYLIADLFARHFGSIFSPSCPAAPDALNFDASQVDPTPFQTPFDESEVYTELMELDTKKGAGSDRLPSQFWKHTADALAGPLTRIFNSSIRCGTFPTAWKEALVTPVFKSGLRSDVKNYRMISVLSCPGKIFDKMMCDRMNGIFRPILGEEQHGFLKGRSTVTNLMDFVSSVTSNMEGGGRVDAIYIDFSKAFDSLNHDLLLAKLSKYGVDQLTVKWFKSYLSGRSLRVKVKSTLSSPVCATSGIPQGSHLGPTVFLIYLNDLVVNLDCDASAYADDLKLRKKIKTIEDCQALQRCVDLTSQWGAANWLHPNVSKCQSITFTRSRRRVSFEYSIGGCPLPSVTAVKDLGIWLDSKLDYWHHIDRTTAKCRSVLGLVKRFAREFDDLLVTRTLFTSLVLPNLDYGSPVWSPFLLTQIASLESIQKQFLIFVLGRRWTADSYVLPPYEDRLEMMGLYRIQDRHQLTRAMFIFDCIMLNIDCPRLRSAIVVNENRTGRHGQYIYPAFHRTQYGKNEPMNKCITTFNQVANIFKESGSRASFKREARAFFSSSSSSIIASSSAASNLLV